MNTFNRVMLVGIGIGIGIAAVLFLTARCATLFGTGVCVW